MRRREFLSVLAAPALRAQPGTGLSIDKVRDIERLIAAEMSRQSIPGMSIAAGRDDAVLWSAGYGLADLENFVPARAITVYRTASVAKPMTAVAALQLYERGKLDLDAPVETYVRTFPPKQWPVTVRQLLGHVGGIRHYRDDAEFYSTRHYDSVTDAVQQFAADDLIAEPGTRYQYSTFGFVLAGAAIESIAGMRFGEYLARNVFEPARMTNTRTDNVYDIIPNRARGYRRNAEGKVLNSPMIDTSNKIPGGGLVSTAVDLVRFAIAIGAGRLLKQSSVDLMFTPQTTRDGRSTGYGLGWGLPKLRNHFAAVHSGGQAGVSTYLWYFPSESVATAVMFDLQDVNMAEFIAGVSKILLEQ